MPFFLRKRSTLNGKKVRLNTLSAGQSEENAILAFYRMFWEAKLNSLEDFLRQTLIQSTDMNKTSSAAEKVLKEGLVLSRIINAPVEKVFQAWADPELFALWWGPQGFINPVCELDIVPNGNINVIMQGPDGSQFPMRGNFIEIIPGKKIVFIATCYGDEKGEYLIESMNTVTFRELDGKTELKLNVEVTKCPPEVVEALGDMETGWDQSLVKLQDLVSV